MRKLVEGHTPAYAIWHYPFTVRIPEAYRPRSVKSARLGFNPNQAPSVMDENYQDTLYLTQLAEMVENGLERIGFVVEGDSLFAYTIIMRHLKQKQEELRNHDDSWALKTPAEEEKEAKFLDELRKLDALAKVIYTDAKIEIKIDDAPSGFGGVRRKGDLSTRVVRKPRSAPKTLRDLPTEHKSQIKSISMAALERGTSFGGD